MEESKSTVMPSTPASCDEFAMKCRLSWPWVEELSMASRSGKTSPGRVACAGRVCNDRSSSGRCASSLPPEPFSASAKKARVNEMLSSFARS
eukprot:6087837-Prymnesium_polylepis.1